MELIRISGDKIKISLTKAELDAYDMSVESMNYGEAATRRAFREIFIEAREQTGFEASDEKVFVQIFRAKNGGCEIFVSKIAKASKNGDGVTRSKEKRSRLYTFDDCEDMIRLCRELCRLGYKGISNAYIYENTFYLMLEDDNGAPFELACEYSSGGERYSRLYIDEHFTLIRENDAVSVLSKA